jgi:hypothetical protein
MENTNEVIEWYNKVNNKDSHSFVCFDICEFYPSITDELVIKAIEYAMAYDTISEQEKHIIIYAKKSMLYNNTPWCKRSNPNFDGQLRWG